ncbi:MAG: putative selenate ABC transporter substrate-binding protein [Planctomycetes bacterium]|nr:putative selenate ABC transporter substrate-binding protein [Planctomycetota bacterium]
MKFSSYPFFATLLGLVTLSACGKDPAPIAASSESAPKPIVVDQKMMEATRQIDEEAAKAAAKLRADAGPKVLRFSGIPNQNTTELAERYAPLAKYLSEKLKVTVEYVPSVDYNAAVDSFKNGDLQLCWFGGFTGVQARAAVPNARAIACGLRDKAFKSYFIANQSLGLKPDIDFPMSFKGKTFTFGSQQSTSGRLMPEHFIRQATKLSPKEFFGSEPGFSKSHDQTLELVAAGTFETGVVDYTVYDKRAKEGKIDPDVVVVVWETPAYYDYQFTAHPVLEETFGAGFTDRLQNVLVAMRGDDLKYLAALDRDEGGLIVCKNEDFDALKKTALDLGLLR